MSYHVRWIIMLMEKNNRQKQLSDDAENKTVVASRDSKKQN